MGTGRRLALLAAVGVLAAGCGGEAGTAGQETAASSGSTQVLALAESSLGEILVDGDGMTVYLFTEDPPGRSVCVETCLAAWPPLTVDADPVVGVGVEPSLVGTIERDDGTLQVTYADAPLYTWVSDQQAGDVTGQGVDGAWFVVGPDGSAIGEDATPFPSEY